MNLYQRIKFVVKPHEDRLLYSVKEFAHNNKDLLIIVCDPKSDRIFATYRDRFVNGKVKAVSGYKANVVKDVLKYSIFDKSIDGFMSSLMETLHLPIMKANQFYQMIDGYLFAIAKSLRKKRQAPHIPSPFVEGPKSNINK